MNRRPPGLKLSKSISGFLQYKAAEALSPRALQSYEHDLNLWLKQVGDRDIGRIATQDLRAYLAWLRADYKPRRFSGADLTSTSLKSIKSQKKNPAALAGSFFITRW